MGNYRDIFLESIWSYRIITISLVIILYIIYQYLKNTRIYYLDKFFIGILLISAIILAFLNINNVEDDVIKSRCIVFIIISIVLFFRSRHDKRGYCITKYLRNIPYFKNKQIYFFPKDFSNEEIDKVNVAVNKIFSYYDKLDSNNKLGNLYIWIKKKNKRINIRIIHQLDYNSNDYSQYIINLFSKIEKELICEFNIVDSIDSKFELIIKL